MTDELARARSLHYESIALMLNDDEAEWLEKANCKGTDPDLFFPSKEAHPGRYGDIERSAIVKRICGECEVKVDCLRYAVVNDIRHGYWGGVSRSDRYRNGKREQLLRRFAS